MIGAVTRKQKTLLLSVISAFAFTVGNLVDRYSTGQLALESATELGGEALACYQMLSKVVEESGKQVPAGPLAAFCTAVASQPEHKLPASSPGVL